MLCMNSLPKAATRQRRGCDLNPGPSAPESSTLTTRLASRRSNVTSRTNVSTLAHRSPGAVVVQVGGGAPVAYSSSRRLRPPSVAERRREVGAERDVVGAAAPPERPRLRRPRARGGRRASTAARGRGARAAGPGDRAQHSGRRQRVDQRLLTTA